MIDLAPALGDAIAGFLIEQAGSTVRGDSDDEEGTLVGAPIEVVGLGAFELHWYESLDGHNPRTGQPVHVPAKLLAFFRPASELRAEIDGAPPSERRYACPALAGVLATRSGLTDETLGHQLHDALVGVVAQLHFGLPAHLGALGTLEREEEEAREGRNPMTGKVLKIPARVRVVFDAGPELRATLNGLAR